MPLRYSPRKTRRARGVQIENDIFHIMGLAGSRVWYTRRDAATIVNIGEYLGQAWQVIDF